MKTIERLPKPVFKTPKGREEYYKAYERTLSIWPIQFKELDISTSFGVTHVIVCGPANEIPIVLLHGAQASSTMWYANIKELAKNNRVYAIDFILETGKSILQKEISSRQDLVSWFLQIFDILHIKQANLVGLSRGAWNAVALSICHPERVNKLVLLSPAQTFTPIKNIRFLALAILCSLFSLDRHVSKMVKTVSANLGKVEPLFIKQYKLALKHFNLIAGISVPPVLFSNAELKSLRVPTLLLIGDHDVINDKTSIRRAEKLIQNIEIEIVRGAGHIVAIDQPEYTDQRILSFLSDIDL